MSTTLSTLVSNAIARCGRAQQDIIADQPTEVIDQVNILLKKWFGFASVTNRNFFGVKQTVDYDGVKWPRPANAQSIWLIKGQIDTDPDTLAGVEIDLVAADDLDAATVRVILLGRAFWPDATGAGPTSGKLDLWFSRVPTLLNIQGDFSQTIDADYPDQHVDLLEIDLAIWIAGRDTRDADTDRLQGALVAAQASFESHLLTAEANLVTRRNVPRPTTPVGQAAAG